MNIGDKIGAYFKLENNICYFLGWGIYLGNFQNPRSNKKKFEEVKNILGQDATVEEINTYLILNKYTGETIPKFQLENGDIVWSDECHWGSVENIQKILEDKKIVFTKYKRDKFGNVEDIIL